jgi:hypothetical protein
MAYACACAGASTREMCLDVHIRMRDLDSYVELRAILKYFVNPRTSIPTLYIHYLPVVL